MSNQLECELECGCKVKKDRKNAKPGTDTYCPKHGISTIGIVHASAWRIICLDCRIGEWWGQDRKGAEKSADHHTNKKGHPTVEVLYDDGTPAKVLRLRLLQERQKVDTLLSGETEEALPPPF